MTQHKVPHWATIVFFYYFSGINTLFHFCSGTDCNCFNFFYSLCCKLHANVLTDTTGDCKIKMDNALLLSPIVLRKREEVPANDFKLSLWLSLCRKGKWRIPLRIIWFQEKGRVNCGKSGCLCSKLCLWRSQ